MLLAKGRKREGANNWRLKYLYDWIMSMTNMFVEKPNTLTKIIYWILNDMVNYTTCPVCGKQIKKFRGHYNKHCSCKCAGKDPTTLYNREETCLKLYNSTNVFSSDYGKRKMQETCMKNHNVPYSGMAAIKKQHTEESNIKKYGVKNVN